MGKDWLKPNWEPKLIITRIPIDYFTTNGIKGLILDVDKTLLEGREIELQQSVKDWLNEAKKSLKLHLLSNNPSKRRISCVANQIGITYTYGASKPRRSSVKAAIKLMSFEPKEIAILGDRIFTDIIVGNRLGLYTVLVLPIGPNNSPSLNNTVQKIEKLFSKIIGEHE